MSIHELPDFETCLKYSILAKKSFLTFSKKEVQKEDNSNEEALPETVIQGVVDTLLNGLKYKCSIVNKIADIKPESIDDVKYDIRIVPDLNSLPRDEQILLAKKILEDETTPIEKYATVIFIGIVSWSIVVDAKPLATVCIHREMLQSDIKIDNWLKHKFWFAGSMPDEVLLNSNESLNISTNEIDDESNASDNISMDRASSIKIKNEFSDIFLEPSVRRYILDIMVHLRMHRLSYRGNGGGIMKKALDDVMLLSKIISFDSGKMFVAPKQIKEASYMYFPMHLILIDTVTKDSTILYGSKSKLVQEFLENIAKVKLEKLKETSNPLFLESLVVKDVINKIVPPI